MVAFLSLSLVAIPTRRVDIQQDASGHDPTEDAVATMRLALYFLKEGER